MKTVIKTICTYVVVCSVFLLNPCAAYAEDKTTTFKNVSISYFSWTPRTLDNTAKGPIGKKGNYAYLEAEGGINATWGDLYGFFDVHNPQYDEQEANALHDRRYEFKLISNFNLTEVAGLPLTLHMQLFDTADDTFHDQNRVIGLGTRLKTGNFWMKPFVGIHQESKTGAGVGFNGVMLGWVLGYNFTLAGESMALTNWHEIEMGRKTKFLRMARDGEVVTGDSSGLSGAAGLTWNLKEWLKLAATYRYALNKLGSATYLDGVILTARFPF